MIIIICCLSLLSIIFPSKKIWRGKDINVFDILLIANFLYYLLIPIYYYITKNSYAMQLVKNGSETFIIILSFQYIALLINIYFSRNKKFTNSILNLSNVFRKIYNSINSIPKYILILLTIIVSLNFYNKVSFSNLQGKNLSNADMEAVFLSQSTLADRINNKLSSLYGIFLYPCLVYGIIAIKKTDHKKLKYWGVFIISLIAMSMLLSSRRPMINMLIFALLFLHAINAKKLKFSHVYKIALLLSFVILVIFPAYQVYRLVKEYTLLNDTNVDIGLVLSETKKILSELDVILEVQESNDNRSLGLFSALNAAIKSDTSYNGWVFFKSISNIFPGTPSLQDNVEFVTANNFAHYGADIADSILMYSVADFKWGGIVFAFIYIYLFVGCYYFIYRVTLRLVNKNFLLLLIIPSIYSIFISLESSPFWALKTVFYVTLPNTIIAIIVYNFAKNKSKKTYILSSN